MMKKIFLLLLIFIVCCPSLLVATTYYISPTGSDSNSGTSCVDAWKTFTYAQDSGRFWCGDTLVLCDGTYNADEGGIVVEMSCTSGDAATFEADNDGSAIVDGDYARVPFTIDNKNYIVVDGIHFKESSSHVIDIDTADNLTFRRVTANDVLLSAGNVHVFRLEGVTNSLFEDCAGWGNGRNIVLIFKPSHHVTLRRFYMLYHNKNAVDAPICVQVYGAHDCLLENVVCTYDGLGTWGSDTEYYLSGIIMWDNNQSSMYNNKAYGSVVFDLNMATYTATDFCSEAKAFQTYGNEFVNCVGINNQTGLGYANNTSLTATNMTLVNSIKGVVFKDNYTNAAIDGLNLKNSVISSMSSCGFDYYTDHTPSGGGSAIVHTYNTFYNNAPHFCDGSQHATENNTNPLFNTAVYGYGAYLMRPDALSGLGESGADIGAEVLYRYEDGVLTSEALWPWPMEARILAESGFSVTYDSAGGLWSTLSGIYEPVPPVISSPLPSGEQACTADPLNVTMQVTTDENATVKYGLSGEDDLDSPAQPVDADTSYDLLPHTFTSTSELAHSNIVSVACGESRTYYVRSMDGDGNKNTASTTLAFSVAAAVEDAGPPTVTITSPADDPHDSTTQYITVSGTASAHGVKTIASVVATGPTFQSVGSVTGLTSWSLPVVVSQGTLSADLLYGAGAFASTGSWSVGTDWTIADGKASHTGVATNCWLSHAFASEIGKTYRVSYPVGAGATGSLWLSQYGFGGVSQPLVITEGAHTIDVVATMANSTLAFAASPFVGDLDNVTVKKLQYDTLTITATDNLGYVGTKTVQLGYIAPELTSPRKVVGLGAKVELDLGGGRQLKF